MKKYAVVFLSVMVTLSFAQTNMFSQDSVVNQTDNIFKPSLYVVAIGVGNYDDPNLRLEFPAKDASDFAQAVIRQAGQMYESVDVRLLTDRSATAENIRDALYWLQTVTTDRDIAMLYIAGHGVNNNSGDFYFMPVGGDINRLSVTCVGYMEIRNAVSNIAGKILVFMDACHSGNLFGNQRRRSAAISNTAFELVEANNGAIVFTSSTGRQFSLESPEWNNGAFTKALVEGLSGSADLYGNNTVTIRGLNFYISNRVKELTQGRQTPTTIIPQRIPDFPIALVVGNVNINITNSTIIIIPEAYTVEALPYLIPTQPGYKPFRVDLGLGLGTAVVKSPYWGFGAYAHFEPKFAIFPQLSIGLKFEMDFVALYDDTNDDVEIDKEINSYFLTVDYHFGQRMFRPFLGAGLGLYESSTSFRIGNETQDRTEMDKFSVMFRGGFDYRHFRLALVCNLRGKDAFDIRSQVFYVGVGTYIGGGRKRR